MKGYGLNWSADFVQDLRYVYRTTKKSPGFAAAVILTLALGMGANAAVFSVINAVLFKPLAYLEPGRIVMLMNTLHGHDHGSSHRHGRAHRAACPNRD